MERASFYLCLRWRPFDESPKQGGEQIERFLSIAEERRLRATFDANIEAHADHPVLKDEGIERKLEFDVSIRSGMRKPEQYNLCWPDIDFKRRIMRLRKTKNGKPRNAYAVTVYA